MRFRGIVAGLSGLSFLFAGVVSGADLREARQELFAGHCDYAAKLYSRAVEASPSSGDAWYGLVRAQLEGHHPKEALVSAKNAIAKAPGTPGAETAAGLADWRGGQLNDAIKHFGAALKLDPNYPGALDGMATVESALSKSRTARDLWTKALLASPDDPDLIVEHAEYLKGSEQIAELAKALAIVDPTSEAGRRLKFRVATARSLGDTRVRRLVSPYQDSTIPLAGIFKGRPLRLLWLSVQVVLNGRQTVTLMLDSDASGISITPRIAERAGLDRITDVKGEATGYGNAKPVPLSAYLAKEVRVGDVSFADFPVQAFESPQSVDYDGVIGTDVFRRFVVKIDFPRLKLILQTRAGGENDDSEPVDRSDAIPPGFVPVMRFGSKFGIATTLNNSGSLLFLIDSGGSASLLDEDAARRFAFTSGNQGKSVRGVQGRTSNGSVAHDVTLTFAGIKQEDPGLLAIDLGWLSEETGTQFGGVLGFPTLNQLAVTIDYREGLVRFEHK